MIGIQFLDKKEYFCMIKTSSFGFWESRKSHVSISCFLIEVNFINHFYKLTKYTGKQKLKNCNTRIWENCANLNPSLRLCREWNTSWNTSISCISRFIFTCSTILEYSWTLHPPPKTHIRGLTHFLSIYISPDLLNHPKKLWKNNLLIFWKFLMK